MPPNVDATRKSQIRRMAIVLGLIAAAFYVGFIVLAVVRNSP